MINYLISVALAASIIVVGGLALAWVLVKLGFGPGFETDEENVEIAELPAQRGIAVNFAVSNEQHVEIAELPAQREDVVFFDVSNVHLALPLASFDLSHRLPRSRAAESLVINLSISPSEYSDRTFDLPKGLIRAVEAPRGRDLVLRTQSASSRVIEVIAENVQHIDQNRNAAIA